MDDQKGLSTITIVENYTIKLKRNKEPQLSSLQGRAHLNDSVCQNHT